MSDAATLWAFRAREEKRAAAMFRWLGEGLEAVDAHPVTLDLARRSVADEERHAVLCADLARGFGATVEVDDVRGPRARRRTRETVLAEVVGMCCINETVSAAILSAMQRNTRGTKGQVHGTVTTILRDEVVHARLGWSHLAFEARRGSVDGLSERIPMLVDAALAGVGDDTGPVSAAFEQVGGLCYADRVGLFHEAMDQVVWPGLERFGVMRPTRAA